MAASDDLFRSTLAMIAPGTALRDGLERVLRGHTGALVVLGDSRDIEDLCTGGFAIDVEFTATRLRELCKMDGAVQLSSDGSRILRANVHLVPDPSIPTDETGTRHRTADRMARQTGAPAISVSHSMNLIALYVDGRRHVIEDSAAILSRANQALATLERYKMRLDEVTGTLSALEIEDLVTLRDALAVLQRLEMVRRIHDELESDLLELGTDGRLVSLQLEELMAGVETERELVVYDYAAEGGGRKQLSVDEVMDALDALTATDLLDLSTIGRCLGFASTAALPDALDAAVSPRGYRMLARVPRIPRLVVDRLVDHFGGLQKLLGADIEDLLVVEGVGESRARSVREGLSRLAEASIVERYV
jgi:diadenylate cyclase